MTRNFSDEIKIFPLNEKPSYAPILAYLSYNEWYLERNIPFEVNLIAYQKRASGEGMPCSFAALYDTYPVGMVTLKEKDLWSREELSPWLSSLWVHPDFRNRGVGGMLIEAVIERAGSNGFKRLYLFTGRDERGYLKKYYTKRGWKFFDSCIDNDGNSSEIYLIEL